MTTGTIIRAAKTTAKVVGFTGEALCVAQQVRDAYRDYKERGEKEPKKEKNR